MDPPLQTGGGRRLVIQRRMPVFTAGDPAETIDEVVSGALALWRLASDGRRQLVELVLPGGFAGFSASTAHGSDCEALVTTSIIRHRRHDIEQDASLRARVIDSLERQLSAMHAHAMMLGRRTAQERLAALVLRLAAHRASAQRQDAPTRIKLPLTRAEIGDHLGLSMETVCRLFAEFDREGILRLGRHHGEILALDIPRLTALAAGE
jgi:CRP-like cAMP-binding protein